MKILYFGAVGSQKTLPIFDKGYPRIEDDDYKNYKSNDTYIYNRNDIYSYPTLFLRLLTPTKTIKAELLDSKTKKVIGIFLTGLDSISRDSQLIRQTPYEWHGTHMPVSMPDSPFHIAVTAGTYLWCLNALKLLGDPKEKKDWESWTSCPILVKN